MSDAKLSALTVLGAAPATNDLIYIDDVSATTSKSMTVANLFTSPSIASPSITGHATIEGVTPTGATGTGKLVFDTAPQISTIELGAASDTTISRSAAGIIAVEGVDQANLSASQTLTNKRVTPRVLSAAAYTTDTGTSINGDTQDMFIVTAQTGALKFNNPSGTPTDGQKLIITVASSTTSARALTWDTAYGSTTVTLPSTTAATTVTLSIGFIWSASKSLWQCVAVA